MLLKVCAFSLQVKDLNFYDIVLDFILMDSFEDLENPPVSIQNVVNNRWLNNSFKETVCTESLAFDLTSTKLHSDYTMIFNKPVFSHHRLLHQVAGLS